MSNDWDGVMSRSMGPEFHPFSDTDLSPPPRYTHIKEKAGNIYFVRNDD